MTSSIKPLRELMIIEDDFDDRYLLRTVLEEREEPINIIEFEDGRAAFESLSERLANKQRLPDLILLDLNMPLFDGFAFLERARKIDALKVVPIVVYTTSSAESDVAKSYQLGANAYMVKPLSFSEIRSMFESTVHYWLNVINTATTGSGAESAMNFGGQRG